MAKTAAAECPVCKRKFEYHSIMSKHIMKEHHKSIPRGMTVYDFYTAYEANKKIKKDEEKKKKEEEKEKKVDHRKTVIPQTKEEALMQKVEKAATNKSKRVSNAAVYLLNGKRAKLYHVKIAHKDMNKLKGILSVLKEEDLTNGFTYTEKSVQNGLILTVEDPVNDYLFCLDAYTQTVAYDRSIFLFTEGDECYIDCGIIIFERRIPTFIENLLKNGFAISFIDYEVE